MSYTIPPDTRTVGSGDPPVDMNDVSDVLTGMGAGYSVLNTAWAGGADPTGAADSTAAITACVTAAAAAGDPCIIPGGTYKTTSTLNWKIPGLVVIGAGSGNTKLRQSTGGTPIVAVAGLGQTIRGITFAYSSQQGSGATSAGGIQFGDVPTGSGGVGSAFMSVFDDVCIELAYQGMTINPAVSGLGAAGLFSCDFRNIRILGWYQNGIYLEGNAGGGAANCTGCSFSNIYLHNNFTGSRAASNSWPILLKAWDEVVFNQLNVEQSSVFETDVIGLSRMGNFVCNGLHLESLALSGSAGTSGYLYMNTGEATIRGMSVRNCTMTGTVHNPVARLDDSNGGPSIVTIEGFNEAADNNVSGTPAHPWVDFGGHGDGVFEVSNVVATEVNSNYVNWAAGSDGQILDGTQVTYIPALPWTTFATGSSPNGLNATSGTNLVPVAGEWYYADLFVPYTVTLTGIIASSPSGGGTDKWIAAIYPSTGGAALANSGTAGVTTPSAANFKLPFTAPVTLPGPAVYKAAVQSNGTTAKIEAFGNAAEGFATGEQSGTFGTVPSLSSPATTYSASLGPMAKTY